MQTFFKTFDCLMNFDCFDYFGFVGCFDYFVGSGFADCFDYFDLKVNRFGQEESYTDFEGPGL